MGKRATVSPVSPVSKKRKRPGHRRPEKRNAPVSIVDAMLAAFADRLDDDGPLQSELLLSALLGMAWGGSEWSRTEAAEGLALEVIDANPTRHPAGGLLLSLIAGVGPEALRDRARRLRDSGLAFGTATWRMPQWVDRIGKAGLGGSAIATDVYGDQASYYLEFSYPGGARPEPHVLVVLVDYNLHLVKDMFVRVGPGILDVLAALGAEDEGTALAELDPQSASDDIWHHLGITDRTIGEPFGEESAQTRYVAAARLAALPPPRPDAIDVADVPEAERDRIVAAFMKTVAVRDLLSGEGTPDAPPERDTVRFIARIAIDYACDYGVGDPLRWSPMAVELFLTDWAPRKVNWEAEDVLWVPEVLDALVAYSGRRKGLGRRWIEETREAVDEYGGDFLALELEGTSKGPAAQLVASMLADGVDLTDELAVQRWVSRYNASL